MKTLTLRITFGANPARDDQSFDDIDALRVEHALLRAFPYCHGSEIQVDEVPDLPFVVAPCDNSRAFPIESFATLALALTYAASVAPLPFVIADASRGHAIIQAG
jgi:hypothetical protein